MAQCGKQSPAVAKPDGVGEARPIRHLFNAAVLVASMFPDWRQRHSDPDQRHGADGGQDGIGVRADHFARGELLGDLVGHWREGSAMQGCGLTSSRKPLGEH